MVFALVIIAGSEAVIARLLMIVQHGQIQLVARGQLPAQPPRKAFVAIAISIGITTGLGVEAVAALGAQAQRIVHRVRAAAQGGIKVTGAVRTYPHPHAGEEALFTFAGEDLDHAGDRVRPVNGSGRAAQHLDAIDLRQRNRVPGGSTGGL